MIVVDTSSWIEWLIDSPLGERIDALLPLREQIIVPTLVQLELTKWLMRTRGEDIADEVLAYTEKCHVVALDTRLAILAAEASRKHGLATADAIIFATAQHLGAELLTCDAHFDGLPSVTYVPKT
jgi:predicted nucleic acid-binding protein